MVSMNTDIQPVTTYISNATSAGINVVSDIKSSSITKVEDIEVQSSKSSDEDVQKLVDDLNKISEEEPLSVSFGFDKELNKVYINVVDKNSGEVVRKLPSEDAMKFAKSMKEVVGRLFDKKG